MRPRPSTAPIDRRSELPSGRHLELVVLSNWGDQTAVGLSGLEVLNENFSDFTRDCGGPALRGVRRASPPSSPTFCGLGPARFDDDDDDLADAADVAGDEPPADGRAALDRLTRLPHVTTRGDAMWLLPLALCRGADAPLSLAIDLGCHRTLGALKVWNYNASLEAAWKSNLQPDFNVRVCGRFDANTSVVLRELDESNRFVQNSAESTSM